LKNTLLYKQLRIAKFNKNLALKTARHSLLLDNEKNIQQNRISAKSDQNSYRFRGKLISSTADRESALSYIKSLFNNDNKEFDFVRFSKTKYKFKKWIESNKTPDVEKSLFRKLLLATENHQDRKLTLDNANQILNKFTHKVKRFNNKKSAISDLIKLHNERSIKDIDQSSQLNIRLIEVLFKIPEHNNQPISAKKQEEILRRYYLEKFPEFDLFLTVIHNDEIIPHVDGFVDGLNQKSLKCDFVEYQYQYIKFKLDLTDLPEKYAKCTTKQVKQIGEWLQQDFYDFTNQLLVEQGHYIEFAKKDLTDEELALRNVIKTNNAKPIAEREFNTANYLAKTNKQYYQQRDNFIFEICSLELKFKELKEHIKLALDFAVEFAKSSLSLDLVRYKKHHNELLNIDESIAIKVEKEAADFQPTEQQKTQIKTGEIIYNKTSTK
tara:strand:+ start:3072 stop:4385 length:1314 start_codon:yes stop_codon:yes gene_type:complete